MYDGDLATTDTQESGSDPACRVQSLIDITTSLNSIFDQENAALADNRAEDMCELQAEKARLAAAYARAVRTMANDRINVSMVDPHLLSDLRDVTAEFESRATHQCGLLDEHSQTTSP